MSFTIRHIVGTKEILNKSILELRILEHQILEQRGISRKSPSNWRMVVHTWHRQNVQDDIAFEVHLHIVPLKKIITVEFKVHATHSDLYLLDDDMLHKLEFPSCHDMEDNKVYLQHHVPYDPNQFRNWNM